MSYKFNNLFKTMMERMRMLRKSMIHYLQTYISFNRKQTFSVEANYK